jgi:hypothetical protein
MSKTLEELGYEKVADTRCDIYEKGKIEGAVMYVKNLEDGKEKIIHFCSPYKGQGEIEIQCTCNMWGKAGFLMGGWIGEPITMKELKAIYKYCEEQGWINE